MKTGEKSLPETVSWNEMDPVNSGDSWTDVWAKWAISLTDWRVDLDVNSFNTNNESQTRTVHQNKIKLNELKIRCAIFYFFLK